MTPRAAAAHVHANANAESYAMHMPVAILPIKMSPMSLVPLPNGGTNTTPLRKRAVAVPADDDCRSADSDAGAAVDVAE